MLREMSYIEKGEADVRGELWASVWHILLWDAFVRNHILK